MSHSVPSASELEVGNQEAQGGLVAAQGSIGVLCRAEQRLQRSPSSLICQPL